MEKHVSEFVVRISFKATSKFTNLISFVRQHTDDDAEYERYRKAMTEIVRIATDEILIPIFDQHPDIREAIDNTINEFGCLP